RQSTIQIKVDPPTVTNPASIIVDENSGVSISSSSSAANQPAVTGIKINKSESLSEQINNNSVNNSNPAAAKERKRVVLMSNYVKYKSNNNNLNNNNNNVFYQELAQQENRAAKPIGLPIELQGVDC